MIGKFVRRDSRKKRLDQPPTAEFLKLRFFRVLIRPGVDDQPKRSAETWPGGLPSAAGRHRRNRSSRTTAARRPATIEFHMLIRQFSYHQPCVLLIWHVYRVIASKCCRMSYLLPAIRGRAPTSSPTPSKGEGSEERQHRQLGGVMPGRSGISQRSPRPA